MCRIVRNSMWTKYKERCRKTTQRVELGQTLVFSIGKGETVFCFVLFLNLTKECHDRFCVCYKGHAEIMKEVLLPALLY